MILTCRDFTEIESSHYYMYSVDKRNRYRYKRLPSAQIIVFFPFFCLQMHPLGCLEDFTSNFFWIDSTADKAEA